MPSHLILTGIPLCIITGSLVNPFVLTSNGEVDVPEMTSIGQVHRSLLNQVVGITSWDIGGR